MSDEEIIIPNSNNDWDVQLSAGTPDESNISYSEIVQLDISDIDLYEPSFIGFGMVGAACLMCYGMIVIINLFRRIV